MPTLKNSGPKYRKHRASGKAVVSIAGRDHYLGSWQTKAKPCSVRRKACKKYAINERANQTWDG